MEIKNEIFVSPQAVELQIGVGLAANPIAVRRIWSVYNPPPHSAIATLAQLARASGPLFLLPVLCFSPASVSGLDPAWHPDPGLHLCTPFATSCFTAGITLRFVCPLGHCIPCHPTKTTHFRRAGTMFITLRSASGVQKSAWYKFVLNKYLWKDELCTFPSLGTVSLRKPVA